MRLLYAVMAASTACAVVLGICGFGVQVTHTVDVPVIVTASSAYDATAAMRGEERFARGAQLLIVRNGKTEPLIEGFAASADADVSFDAKMVLFTGKKNANDAWAIWELTLADRSLRKVIGGNADAIRPLYLPDDRLVYAERTPQGFQLATALLDGSDALQLTHVNASAIPSDVLEDGRILFESMYPLGEGKTPELYLVYSDGSGVESYRCDHGSARWAGKQLASGDVVFTHGSGLARFTSPLAVEAAIVAPKAEYQGNVVEVRSGQWLVSARSGNEANASLKLLRLGAQQLLPIVTQRDEDLVEPVLVRERPGPHRHPSALHDWTYGNLLALDARESREGDLKALPATVRVETLDANGRGVALGTAPVEPDGSFFLKAPGDRPIRFALLDEKGTVLREEHGWFWIRKGEQRICVGCHTGPERAPENRVPAVLLRTTTPVDLTGTTQQTIAGSR
jgi:Hydrazine synthase alpha subunit middle domain